MTAVRVTRQIVSEQLDLPELKPFIGREVEITIRDKAPTTASERWQALVEIAGADLIEPGVAREYREFDAQQQADRDVAR